MLRFLYTTAPGRMLLKPLTSRGFSRLAGKFMDSRASTALIKPFVRKNKIDLSEYEPARYRSFNEFFIRKVRPECRPVAPEGLIAPCDGLLSAYKIDDKTRLNIKNSVYSIQTLLGNDPRAAKFAGGTCLVFRLCVDNYHRYHFFDDCAPEPSRFIPGVLHTVRPIALENVPVFHQNCREVTFLHTKSYGLAAQIEVGAMLVGKIHNHKIAGIGKTAYNREAPIDSEERDEQDCANGENCAAQAAVFPAHRGEEKGYFLYGGSTVVLLLNREAARLPEFLYKSTANDQETPVKCGQRLSDQ